MKENERNVIEVSDEELAKVVGGDFIPTAPTNGESVSTIGKCPNGYTLCTENCLSANCSHLAKRNGYECTCGRGLAGSFLNIEGLF